jgi:hypothetical protein
VGPRPEAHAGGDFAAADAVAEALGKDHEESLYAAAV